MRLGVPQSTGLLLRLSEQLPPEPASGLDRRGGMIHYDLVILYVKSGCPWCVDAEQWLSDRGHRFQRINVLTDAAAFARMRDISGQPLAPTLEMPDGRVLADFDVGQLEGFLTGGAR